ncbi:MAG: riboflavin synthase, partial [Armatimonadota bacterium]
GDSVAVNGTCLTVVRIAPPLLEFDAVSETVERTTLARLRPGDPVNLERALRAGDRLGGHMVQGHVDGTGRLSEMRKAGNQTLLRFAAPTEILRYVVEKGSIAVDGASLTVAEVDGGSFAVAVIPHTLAETTLGDLSTGSAVNLETDIIGKYVYKFVSKTDNSDGELMGKLRDAGFME